MRPVVLAILVVAGGSAVPPAWTAPDTERRAYRTRRAELAPTVDGRLDDPAWRGVEWSQEFVQREPADGQPPTRQTRFKVVYDDQAVYFAIQAFDDPGQLARLLARRDRFPGDWVEVNIDSYSDRRTAFSFTLSLSGTRGDELVSNDGDRWDPNWDPVWEGATHVDDEGWTAEMRIPLSQLRFGGAASQTWGLQVQRRIFRLEERSTWQPIPKDVTGWVSRFGELQGLDGLQPPRRLELMPYVVSSAERRAAEPGNPFRDGGAENLTGGLDGKLGVTSDLTLDFTLNPDFGQVEADPSEVNLTAFETFFDEKRPFFVEGSNIFELPLAPAIAGGPFTSDRLFYSRRIGARPPRSAEPGHGEYADQPDRASILGAFKLSGKTPGGLSLGVLESVTAREQSRIEGPGRRRHETVAPLTSYFAGRLQQDLRGGDTELGLMVTAVDRDLDDPKLAFLPAHAYAASVDFGHYFNDRDYRIEGNLSASHVRGSRQAIDDLQRSPARYFQRPDHDHASLDPDRTTLTGQAGSLRLARTASNSGFRFQTGAAWRSPGFEINDLGFMRRAGEINQFGWAAYQFRNPFSVFRRLELNVNQWLDWDFGGRFLRAAANTNAHALFKNNARVGGGVTREGESISNSELRGGPASKWPGAWSYQFYAVSDSRRPFHMALGGNGRLGDEDSERTRRWWVDLIYRPTNALHVTLSPSFSRTRRELQYVGTRSLGTEERYLFGRLDQDTLALTFRVDLSLSPDLTLQYYGAPFASSGSYTAIKRIVDPLAAAYPDRFRAYRPDQFSLDAPSGDFRVDEDQDGIADFRFGRPDFDVREFNSTLVLRWEYRPGSLVFVVWSQARVDDLLAPGGLAFGRGLRETFRAQPHNVFLIKFSRWFSL